MIFFINLPPEFAKGVLDAPISSVPETVAQPLPGWMLARLARGIVFEEISVLLSTVGATFRRVCHRHSRNDVLVVSLFESVAQQGFIHQTIFNIKEKCK